MTPDIRFKGFNQDWEQRKLGVENDVRDGTHDSPKYFDSGYPLITSKNLKDYGLDMTDVSLISHKDFEAINQRSKVDRGDILFGMIGTIGNPVLIERDDFAIKNVALIKEQKNVLNRFLIQLLKSPIFDKYIENEMAGGTQKFLSLSKIRSFNFRVPSTKEQASIANFLGQLDDTIALHQDKLEKLNQLRNGYLQIIFPQNDEKTPRLRFANFSSDWEKRKLEDLATFSKGSGYTKSDLVEEGTPIILYGRLYTKYQTIIERVDTFVNMKEKSVLSEGDEVIVPSSGESSEDIARASVVATAGILLGGDLNIIKTISDINSTFLALNISNGKQQKELSKKAQGKSVVHLHNSDLKKIDLTYPVVEVQIQIGNFFKQLDHTITLQHNKTEKLKQLKKVYLQKLFV
ncbi:MAG: restriction endonuclease subunit S [Carnobacterium sp.]|uniref:restriction endonuclease subunit S n=1 Tax=Carnobacterium sp. TaxID=48221 RepID=UPI0033162C39